MKLFRTLMPVFWISFLISCASPTGNAYQPPLSEESSLTSVPLKILLPTRTSRSVIITPEIPPVKLTASPQAAQSRSLYFLSAGSIWVLRSDSQKPEKVTPPEEIVTVFDVWPGDSRLAFATGSGELFSIFPGGQAELVFQVTDGSLYPSRITGIDWSPDGNSLAFTVGFVGEGGYVFSEYPSYPSGLWRIDVRTREAVWLISNHYPGSIDDRVTEVEKFTDPVWSPDGKSILVSGYYWEWMNKVWFDPLENVEDDRTKHSVSYSPDGDFESWRSASWTPDSSGLLLSGKTYATFSDLILANRQDAETKTLINGELAGLYIFEAYAIPPESPLFGEAERIHDGPDRFVFLADCPACEENSSARLYAYQYNDGSLEGQAVGPEYLCTGRNENGENNYPHYIEWAPDFASGVLICGINEIYIIDLLQESPQLIDLIPTMPTLPGGEIPTFRWGEE